MNGTIAAQAPRMSNSMPLARPRERAIRIRPPLNGSAVWSDMTHLRRGTRLFAALLMIFPATGSLNRRRQFLPGLLEGIAAVAVPAVRCPEGLAPRVIVPGRLCR